MNDLIKKLTDLIIFKIRIPNIIKVFFVILLILFLTSVYHNAGAKDIPLSAIDRELRAETGITSLHKCSARELLQHLGIDDSMAKSFLYYKTTKALGVEEMLIIKTRRKQDLEMVQDLVESRIDSQIRIFEGYGPEQTAMLNHAAVITRGNYLFYCVAPDKRLDQREEVFKNAV